MIAGFSRQALADLIGAKHLMPTDVSPLVHDRMKRLVRRLVYMISNIEKQPQYADVHAEDAEALAWSLRVLSHEDAQGLALEQIFGRSNNAAMFTTRGDGNV